VCIGGLSAYLGSTSTAKGSLGANYFGELPYDISRSQQEFKLGLATNGKAIPSDKSDSDIS